MVKNLRVEQEFMQYYNQGLNDTEISKEIGCSHSTITIYRQKLGLEKNFKYRYKVSNEDLIKLNSEGLNNSEIARKFNVSSSSINYRRLLLGLPIRKLSGTIDKLTEEEHQVLIGTILGDTHISRWSESGKCGSSGMFAHSLKQECYARWKAEKLQRIVSRIAYGSQIHWRNGKENFKIMVDFRTYDALNYYRDIFYTKNGKKIVVDEIINQLTPLSIAIWYMDDGTKSTQGGYIFCTNSFTYEEVASLGNYFKNKFNIDTSIHNKKADQPMLYVKKSSSMLFTNLIKQFFPPCMLYKLHTDENMHVKPKDFNKKGVIQLDLYGNFIRRYDSLGIAGKESGLGMSQVLKYLKGHNKRKSKKWNFVYESDYIKST